MKKQLSGYALTNCGYLLGEFFNYRRDAIAFAKYLVSNHPGHNWKDSYKVVKATLTIVEET